MQVHMTATLQNLISCPLETLFPQPSSHRILSLLPCLHVQGHVESRQWRMHHTRPVLGHTLEHDLPQLILKFPVHCMASRDFVLQTIRDGKSIIIEGMHLDPGLYLDEFGKYGIRHLHSRSNSMLPSGPSTAQHGDAVPSQPVSSQSMSLNEAVQQRTQVSPAAPNDG